VFIQQQNNTRYHPMSLTLPDILDVLRAQMPLLREKYAVSELGVFGSFARGEQREGSDVDVLVAFSQTPSLLDLAGIKNDLEDVMGVEVDVVMRDALKRYIAPFVLREVQYL
jgi:uncharacterized protein